MTDEQAARKMYENWMAVHAQRFHVGGDIESFIEALSAALAARERAVWDMAIQAGEREAYALAPTQTGGQQLAVRMILEALRQQAEAVTP